MLSAGGTTPSGSCLGSLAAKRADIARRSLARVFHSVAVRCALFAGFLAVAIESGFSGSHIIGYDFSTSRRGPAARAAGQTRDFPVRLSTDPAFESGL